LKRPRTAVTGFVAETSWGILPDEVRQDAGRCLLDLARVPAGGDPLPQASIVRDHVLARGARAPWWFAGQSLEPADVAWASATALESLDAHDGHDLTKGYAGVARLPGLLALYSRRPDAVAISPAREPRDRL
jgi:2-methylcitrate dehydratase PrpD